MHIHFCLRGTIAGIELLLHKSWSAMQPQSLMLCRSVLLHLRERVYLCHVGVIYDLIYITINIAVKVMIIP